MNLVLLFHALLLPTIEQSKIVEKIVKRTFKSREDEAQKILSRRDPRVRGGESVDRGEFLLLLVSRVSRLARQSRGWKIHLWKVCR